MEALKFPGPQLKDGDGDEPEDTLTTTISIEVVQNGFIVRAMLDDGEEWVHVYPYDGKKDLGPAAMLNDLRHALGITDKVAKVEEK